MGPQFSEHAGGKHMLSIGHNVKVREPAAEEGLEAVASPPGGPHRRPPKGAPVLAQALPQHMFESFADDLPVLANQFGQPLPGRIGLQPLPGKDASLTAPEAISANQ